MRVLERTRSGEYFDVAVFGVPLGRWLAWAAVIAAVHRVIYVVVSLFAFSAGLGGHSADAHLIGSIHEILDLPVLLLLGRPHGYLESFGIAQIGWSVLFGLLTAFFVVLYRTRSHATI